MPCTHGGVADRAQGRRVRGEGRPSAGSPRAPHAGGAGRVTIFTARASGNGGGCGDGASGDRCPARWRPLRSQTRDRAPAFSSSAMDEKAYFPSRVALVQDASPPSPPLPPPGQKRPPRRGPASCRPPHRHHCPRPPPSGRLPAAPRQCGRPQGSTRSLAASPTPGGATSAAAWATIRSGTSRRTSSSSRRSTAGGSARRVATRRGQQK